MPRTKETIVYKYAELSDKAKARARDWWREASAGDNDFAEAVTDDFHEALKALGFDVYERRGRYLDPRDPRAVRSTVSWSGFWSQGDGASFAGRWYASECAPGKLLADRPIEFGPPEKRETCKSNAELHRIAGEILACNADGLVFARITRSNRNHFMALESADFDHVDEDAREDSAPDYLRERFIQAARDLASWFYRALEAEHEYQNSDEQVAESIVANEYEFTEDGRIA